VPPPPTTAPLPLGHGWLSQIRAAAVLLICTFSDDLSFCYQISLFIFFASLVSISKFD
jgi:hypothetical protein